MPATHAAYSFTFIVGHRGKFKFVTKYSNVENASFVADVACLDPGI